jgi:TonB family protein
MHTKPSTSSGFLSVPSNDQALGYALLKRATLDPSEVEDTSALTVEVTILWGRNILHVSHLPDSTGFTLVSEAPKTRSPARLLTPGFALGAAFTVTGAALGAQGHLALAAVGALATTASLGGAIVVQRRNERLAEYAEYFVIDPTVLGAKELPVVLRQGSAARFVLYPDTRGEVEIDGETRTLEALVAAGIAHPSKTVDGAYEVNIVPGGRYTMQFDAFALQARLVPAGRTFTKTARREPTLYRSLAASACAVAVALGLTHLAGQESALLSSYDHEARLTELRAFVAHQREQLVDRSEPLDREAAAVTASTGTTAPRRQETMPRRGPEAHEGRREGRSTGSPRRVQETNTRDAVASRGIFASLTAAMRAQDPANGIASPFSTMTEAAPSPHPSRGNLEGTDAGDPLGFERLGPGLSTDGREHGVYISALNTRGRSNCPPGEECRYGHTQGSRLVARGTHGPVVTPRPPTVEGEIAPETIRRVVVRNIGQVNQCYSQGLTLSPTAAGRVTVRFVISPDGTVLQAGIAQNDLGIASVGDCIANAVRRWQFSMPRMTGPVTVTYPFMLRPADL